MASIISYDDEFASQLDTKAFDKYSLHLKRNNCSGIPQLINEEELKIRFSLSNDRGSDIDNSMRVELDTNGIKEANLEIRTLQAECKLWMERHQGLKILESNLRLQLSDAQQMLQAQESWPADLAKLKLENDHLAYQVESYKNQVRVLEQDLRVCEEFVVDLKLELESSSRKRTRHSPTIIVTPGESELTAAKRLLVDYCPNCAANGKPPDKSYQTSQDLQSALKISIEKCRILESDLAATNAKMVELEAKYQIEKLSMSSLTYVIDKLKAKVQFVSDQLERKSLALDSCEKDNFSLRKSLSDLQVSHSKLEAAARHTAVHSDNLGLQIQLKVAQTKVNEFEVEVAKVLDDNQALRRHLEDRDVDIQGLTRKLQDGQSVAATMNAEIRRLQGECRQWVETAQELRLKESDLRLELAHTQDKCMEKDRRIVDSESSHLLERSVLTKANADLSAQIAASQDELSATLEVMEEMELQLQEMAKHRASSDAAIAELERKGLAMKEVHAQVCSDAASMRVEFERTLDECNGKLCNESHRCALLQEELLIEASTRETERGREVGRYEALRRQLENVLESHFEELRAITVRCTDKERLLGETFAVLTTVEASLDVEIQTNAESKLTIMQLTEDLRAVAAVRVLHVERIAVLESEVNRVQMMTEELRSALSVARLDLKESAANQIELDERYRESLSVLERESERMLDRTRHDHDELEIQLGEALQDKRELITQVQASQLKTAALSESKDKLQQKIEKIVNLKMKKVFHSGLQNQSTDFLEEQLMTELEKKEGILAELRTCKRAVTRQAELESELSAAMSSNEEIQSCLDKVSNDNRILTTELEKSRQVIEELRKLYSTSEKTALELKIELADANDQCTRLEEKLSSTNNAYVAMESYVSDGLQQFEGKFSGLWEERCRLNEDLNRAELDVSKLQRELMEMRSQRDTIKAEADAEMARRTKALNDSISKLSVLNESLEAQLRAELEKNELMLLDLMQRKRSARSDENMGQIDEMSSHTGNDTDARVKALKSANEELDSLMNASVEENKRLKGMCSASEQALKEVKQELCDVNERGLELESKLMATNEAYVSLEGYVANGLQQFEEKYTLLWEDKCRLNEDFNLAEQEVSRLKRELLEMRLQRDVIGSHADAVLEDWTKAVNESLRRLSAYNESFETRVRTELAMNEMKLVDLKRRKSQNIEFIQLTTWQEPEPCDDRDRRLAELLEINEKLAVQLIEYEAEIDHLRGQCAALESLQRDALAALSQISERDSRDELEPAGGPEASGWSLEKQDTSADAVTAAVDSLEQFTMDTKLLELESKILEYSSENSHLKTANNELMSKVDMYCKCIHELSIKGGGTDSMLETLLSFSKCSKFVGHAIESQPQPPAGSVDSSCSSTTERRVEQQQLASTKAALKDALLQLEDEITRRCGCERELRKAESKAISDLVSADERYEKLAVQLDELKRSPSELEVLQRRVVELQEIADKAASLCTDKEKQLEQALDHAEYLQSELEGLKLELADVKARNGLLENDVGDVAALSCEVEEVRRGRAELRRERDALKQSLAQLDLEWEQRHSQLQKLFVANKAKYDKQYAALEHTLATTSAGWTERLRSLEVELAEAQRSLMQAKSFLKPKDKVDVGTDPVTGVYRSVSTDTDTATVGSARVQDERMMSSSPSDDDIQRVCRELRERLASTEQSLEISIDALEKTSMEKATLETEYREVCVQSEAAAGVVRAAQNRCEVLEGQVAHLRDTVRVLTEKLHDAKR